MTHVTTTKTPKDLPLRTDLKLVLSRYGLDNDLDTPDYELADDTILYLQTLKRGSWLQRLTLRLFTWSPRPGTRNAVVVQAVRDAWYGAFDWVEATYHRRNVSKDEDQRYLLELWDLNEEILRTGENRTPDTPGTDHYLKYQSARLAIIRDKALRTRRAILRRNGPTIQAYILERDMRPPTAPTGLKH